MGLLTTNVSIAHVSNAAKPTRGTKPRQPNQTQTGANAACCPRLIGMAFGRQCQRFKKQPEGKVVSNWKDM